MVSAPVLLLLIALPLVAVVETVPPLIVIAPFEEALRIALPAVVEVFSTVPPVITSRVLTLSIAEDGSNKKIVPLVAEVFAEVIRADPDTVIVPIPSLRTATPDAPVDVTVPPEMFVLPYLLYIVGPVAVTVPPEMFTVPLSLLLYTAVSAAAETVPPDMITAPEEWLLTAGLVPEPDCELLTVPPVISSRVPVLFPLFAR